MDEFIKKQDVLTLIEQKVLDLFPGGVNPKRAAVLMVMNLIQEMPAEHTAPSSERMEPVRLKKIEDEDTVTYQAEDGTRFRFNKQDNGRLKGILERLYKLERNRVDVVRCNECIDNPTGPVERGSVWCVRNCAYRPYDGYCHYGKRRDEE